MFGYAKSVQFGRKIFTSSPVAYITVHFKKLVFHGFGDRGVQSGRVSSFSKRIENKHIPNKNEQILEKRYLLSHFYIPN